MKKICIVTGTRAEWGLLSGLARLFGADSDVRLQIIATNMHLDERFGMTVREIEEQGFQIDWRVPMRVEGDDSRSTVLAMGMAMNGFAQAYEDLRPDVIIVLGDRYEILAAVSAALIYKIPVAHLHGGEITEGAWDDSIRHAVTKMSHLHFTSTEAYRQRVIRMGEQPERVFNVGAIGVDNIRNFKLWDRSATEESLGFALDRNTIVVTFHPVTMRGERVEELLAALDDAAGVRVVFTMPNSDAGNEEISRAIREWCERNRDRAVCFASLGQMRYLSTLQFVGGVVGNSSSGIIEVPSFGIPTLDIGDRQKGRIAAESVVHCKAERGAIGAGLRDILARGPKTVDNPYYKEDTARVIFETIKGWAPEAVKQFYDAND